MRAETKAIIASVLVIALALTAVSGVTYSWWSDSESAEITISTGKMDLSISGMSLKTDGIEVTGFTATSGTDGKYAVSFAIDPPKTPDEQRTYTLTYKADCTNSVDSVLVIETKAELDWLWVTNVAGQQEGATTVDAGCSYNEGAPSVITRSVDDSHIEVAPGEGVAYAVTITFVVDVSAAVGAADAKLELCTTLVQEDGKDDVNNLN